MGCRNGSRCVAKVSGWRAGRLVLNAQVNGTPAMIAGKSSQVRLTIYCERWLISGNRTAATPLPAATVPVTGALLSATVSPGVLTIGALHNPVSAVVNHEPGRSQRIRDCGAGRFGRRPGSPRKLFQAHAGRPGYRIHSRPASFPGPWQRPRGAVGQMHVDACGHGPGSNQDRSKPGLHHSAERHAYGEGRSAARQISHRAARLADAHRHSFPFARGRLR